MTCATAQLEEHQFQIRTMTRLRQASLVMVAVSSLVSGASLHLALSAGGGILWAYFLFVVALPSALGALNGVVWFIRLGRKRARLQDLADDARGVTGGLGSAVEKAGQFTYGAVSVQGGGISTVTR